MYLFIYVLCFLYIFSLVISQQLFLFTFLPSYANERLSFESVHFLLVGWSTSQCAEIHKKLPYLLTKGVQLHGLPLILKQCQEVLCFHNKNVTFAQSRELLVTTSWLRVFEIQGFFGWPWTPEVSIRLLNQLQPCLSFFFFYLHKKKKSLKG